MRAPRRTDEERLRRAEERVAIARARLNERSKRRGAREAGERAVRRLVRADGTVRAFGATYRLCRERPEEFAGWWVWVQVATRMDGPDAWIFDGDRPRPRPGDADLSVASAHDVSQPESAFGRIPMPVGERSRPGRAGG